GLRERDVLLAAGLRGGGRDAHAGVALLEVEVAPPHPAQLAAPKAGRERHEVEQPAPLADREEPRALLLVDPGAAPAGGRLALVLLAPGGLLRGALLRRREGTRACSLEEGVDLGRRERTAHAPAVLGDVEAREPEERVDLEPATVVEPA